MCICAALPEEFVKSTKVTSIKFTFCGCGEAVVTPLDRQSSNTYLFLKPTAANICCFG